MVACLLFPILTTLAMFFYPGGTRTNPGTPGYSFFEKFFSELGLSQSYAGGPQTASFLLFTTALTLAGAALVLYYSLAPSLFWETTRHKILSILGSIFGIISGIFFIGVAFTPADLYLTPHTFFVQLAFLAVFFAVTFYAATIFFQPGFPNRYGWVNLSFGVLLGIYIWLLFNGPSPESHSGLVIQVTGQKIIAYAAVISMFITAFGSRRVLEKGAPSPSPAKQQDNRVPGG
jgi:hypothetical protein